MYICRLSRASVSRYTSILSHLWFIHGVAMFSRITMYVDSTPRIWTCLAEISAPHLWHVFFLFLCWCKLILRRYLESTDNASAQRYNVQHWGNNTFKFMTPHSPDVSCQHVNVVIHQIGKSPTYKRVNPRNFTSLLCWSLHPSIALNLLELVSVPHINLDSIILLIFVDQICPRMFVLVRSVAACQLDWVFSWVITVTPSSA